MRTHQLAKIAEVHNTEMVVLSKRLAQAKKMLETFENNIKFDFPASLRQFDIQNEVDPPHSLHVARYLVATDDETKKTVADHARQAGRIWSEDRIQRMTEYYVNHVSEA